MGAPGASHLGTWESTNLGSPDLFFLDIRCDSLYAFSERRVAQVPGYCEHNH